MEGSENPRRRDYPLTPAKMSKTPSWIMLGFVLGALFVAALPPLHRNPDKSPAMRPTRVPEYTTPPPPRQPQPLTTIEDVFAVWGEHAVWSDDTTEVAFWNKEYQDFTDCFEVRRVENKNYFRSIPRLTRRIVTHGKPLPNSPFRFTETEEQYREWLEHGRTELPVERESLTPPKSTVATPDFTGEVRVEPLSLPPPPLPRIIPTP
jgi:hypothetical protein